MTEHTQTRNSNNGQGCGTWCPDLERSNCRTGCPDLERSTAAVCCCFERRAAITELRRNAYLFCKSLVGSKRANDWRFEERRSCASHFGGKDGNTPNATKGSESSCCHTRVNNNKTCPAKGRARVYHARSSMSTPGLSGPKPWMHQPAS